MRGQSCRGLLLAWLPQTVALSGQRSGKPSSFTVLATGSAQSCLLVSVALGVFECLVEAHPSRWLPPSQFTLNMSLTELNPPSSKLNVSAV